MSTMWLPCGIWHAGEDRGAMWATSFDPPDVYSGLLVLSLDQGFESSASTVAYDEESHQSSAS